MSASPGESTSNAVEQEAVISAPATTVYRLLSKTANWPRIFPSTIYVDQIETKGGEERIRIWETANGEAKTWTSHRVFDPYGLRIDFTQEQSGLPVASLDGTWLIEPRSGTESRVRLVHNYRAADGDPARIAEEVERNSRLELAALKSNVEFAHAATDLAFSFTDTVQIDGSAEDVYDFINDAHLWQERLPHVARVRLTEDTPGLQTLEMDTRAKDGSTHTTTSHRVTLPHRRIAYKQVTLPALMTLHTGIWTFKDSGDGVAASSQHTVVLNTDNITRILGPDADVAQARDYVRTALSTNSTATLNHAKEYAENRR
ncbi:aromatase/cyclase [Streptomyces sp. BPTC-684]|uniref:aromatase/cyclase n=1 Tax=Streptomyces sp. BPTC-684 TaxID=3043734 RepID=UPI0024B273BB|nr:aromatase/cyclase [Streptomyces sp. BPTC-684]WHM36506.1 aromatase/cyclase [Streptomyces sp. BPTC-684]